MPKRPVPQPEETCPTPGEKDEMAFSETLARGMASAKTAMKMTGWKKLFPT
jgi:hypothetical protein